MPVTGVAERAVKGDIGERDSPEGGGRADMLVHSHASIFHWPPMKTLSLSELRRDPVAALKAVYSGRAMRVTRRAEVIAEFAAGSTMVRNPLADPAYLKRHAPPRPRTLKPGEKGVASLLAQDRDER